MTNEREKKLKESYMYVCNVCKRIVWGSCSIQCSLMKLMADQIRVDIDKHILETLLTKSRVTQKDVDEVTEEVRCTSKDTLHGTRMATVLFLKKDRSSLIFKDGSYGEVDMKTTISFAGLNLLQST